MFGALPFKPHVITKRGSHRLNLPLGQTTIVILENQISKKKNVWPKIPYYTGFLCLCGMKARKKETLTLG